MSRKRLIVIAALIVAACAWRIINAHFGLAPNVELLTAAGFAAAMLTRSWIVALLPVAGVCLTDVVIGNSSVLLFTWSAWLLIGAAAFVGRRMPQHRRLLGSVVFGAAGSTVFFLWTNFGVWLLGDGSMYPRTAAGLLGCYVAGIPFYRTMLLANLVLVPAVYAITTALNGPIRSSHSETLAVPA